MHHASSLNSLCLSACFLHTHTHKHNSNLPGGPFSQRELCGAKGDAAWHSVNCHLAAVVSGPDQTEEDLSPPQTHTNNGKHAFSRTFTF